MNEAREGSTTVGADRQPSDTHRIRRNRRRGRRGARQTEHDSGPTGMPQMRCVRMTVMIPTDWPVASRDHIAVAKLQIVDRRDDAVLVCDGLHDGPHFWPDVEPAPPIWDDELDASLAEGLEPAPGASEPRNRQDARESPSPKATDDQ